MIYSKRIKIFVILIALFFLASISKIYLKREQEEFRKTKEAFEEKYEALLERMYATFKRKGAARDVGAPFHHRQPPQGSLAIAQAKFRRVESLLSIPDWEKRSDSLADIQEECVDASNYLLFIAALCSMLQEEVD